MKKILGELSPDLDKTFLAILERIEAENPHQKDIALGALKWLLSQGGWCEAEDLLTALRYMDTEINENSFNSDRENYDNLEFDMNPDSVVNPCLDLVEYRDGFAFTHLSVQEYLGKKLPEPHVFAAQQCLRRLLDTKHHEDSSSASFTDLATSQWASLVQQAEKEAKAIDPTLPFLLKRFLGFPGPVSVFFESWLRSAGWQRMISQKGYDFSFSWEIQSDDLSEDHSDGSKSTSRSASGDSNGSFIKQLKLVTRGIKAIDVACFLGLGSLFDSLSSDSTTLFEELRSPNLLQRSRINSNYWQCFPALSPATSPVILKKYLNLTVQSSKITYSEALWQLLAVTMLYQNQMYMDNSLALLELVETIIAVVPTKLSYPEERSQLLGATINLVLRYSYARTEVVAAALKKLIHAGGRAIVDAFERPPGFRWLNSLEELLHSVDKDEVEQLLLIGFNEHGAARDVDGLRPGLPAESRSEAAAGLPLVAKLDLLALLALSGTDDESRGRFVDELISPTASVTPPGALRRDADTSTLAERDLVLERCLSMVLSIIPKTRNEIFQELLILPLLLWAAYEGLVNSCRVLLSGGAWVSDQGSDYESATTPLTEFISRGTTFEIAKLFIEPSGSYPERVPPTGRLKLLGAQTKYGTPLIAACSKGSLELCNLLLNHQADPNVSSSIGTYGTPLLAACSGGDTELCRLLLGHKADPNISSSIGEYSTPLIAACSGEHAELCFLLLDHGAAIDATALADRRLWLLTAICSRGNRYFDSHRPLVWHEGIDVNAQLPLSSGEYGTALIAACAQGKVQVCRFLVETASARVDLEVSSGNYGTALIAACAQGHVEICRFLVEAAGAEVNAAVSSGKYGTALVAACAEGNVEICRLLVEKGAQVDNGDAQLVGPFGGTALFAACATKKGGNVRLKLCRILLENGAKPDVICPGKLQFSTVLTPGASWRRSWNTAGDGHPPRRGEFQFGTALIAACWHNNADVCELLIKSGADAGLEMSKEYTYTCALEAAEAAGWHEQRQSVHWKVDEINHFTKTGDMLSFNGSALRFLRQHLQEQQRRSLS